VFAAAPSCAPVPHYNFTPRIHTPNFTVKWYYVLVAFILAPLLALPNSYGCGLTDWDNCSMFGKLALFGFAGWAGTEVRHAPAEAGPAGGVGAFWGGASGWRAASACHAEGPAAPALIHGPTHLARPRPPPQGNGVIAGLGICGVILSACSSAAVLMQDFRTGYITTSSPRAMFVSQVRPPRRAAAPAAPHQRSARLCDGRARAHTIGMPPSRGLGRGSRATRGERQRASDLSAALPRAPLPQPFQPPAPPRPQPAVIAPLLNPLSPGSSDHWRPHGLLLRACRL
jgi:hypothetical protein